MLVLGNGWETVLKINALALLAGCVLDWLWGDPLWLPHPVRLMGRMIAGAESRLRRHFPGRELLAGRLLVLYMCIFWTAVPALGLWLLWTVSVGRTKWPLLLAESLMCYQLLAARGLCSESMKVCRALEHGDTEDARGKVSMIVGRDTAPLDQAGIARAAVETVAENASDGVIAPMLWMVLLGPVGGYLYKAVNTMDSMVGYKNEKYMDLGRCAARLDDLLNLVPARLTGLLFCAAAWITPGADPANGWKIFHRDRFNHASPNSAHGEAACAGALRLRLAGDAWYFGELHRKPYIGDDLRSVEAADIRRANRLMFSAQGLFLLICGAVMAAAWLMAGRRM